MIQCYIQRFDLRPYDLILLVNINDLIQSVVILVLNRVIASRGLGHACYRASIQQCEAHYRHNFVLAIQLYICRSCTFDQKSSKVLFYSQCIFLHYLVKLDHHNCCRFQWHITFETSDFIFQDIRPL